MEHECFCISFDGFQTFGENSGPHWELIPEDHKLTLHCSENLKSGDKYNEKKLPSFFKQKYRSWSGNNEVDKM
jgi:hypothetical protein